MFRSMLCCCGSNVSGRHRRIEDDYDHIQDEDLLLPGDLQWDKTSKSFIKSGRISHGDGNPDGYVPPSVPVSHRYQQTDVPKIEDFKLLKTVGKGAFGKVMMAVHSPSHTLYAIKAVPKSKVSTPKQIRQILAEIQILKKVKHPFCVSLQFAFQDNYCLFYAFEFASGGMLFYHLREEGKFSETKARFYIGEIILALEYLHSFGVIFRDLKPENCMLSAVGHILLTDFGCAKQLTGAEKTATLAGTPHYMAPEVLRGEPYSYSADWWSTGVILYEMLVGKTPFHSSDRLELYRTILKCTFKIPGFVSLRAQSLLYKLIERNPELRLGYTSNPQQLSSGTEIKEHSFFSTHLMTSGEEAQYQLEQSERQRAVSARNRQDSFSSSLARRLSVIPGRHMSFSSKPEDMCCTWAWDKLANKEVDPPFRPRLSRPTDCSYFDPIMTCIPPSVNDLHGVGSLSCSVPPRVNIIEAFNYNASVPPSSTTPAAELDNAATNRKSDIIDLDRNRSTTAAIDQPLEPPPS